MSCGRGNPVRVSFMGAELSPHQLEEAGVVSGRRVQILRCRDCGMTSYQYLDESGRWVRGTEDGPCGHSHRFTVEEELEDKTVQVLRCRNCGGISIGWM